MPKPIRKPSYTHHKPSGQARVRIHGTDHYLGPYGSPESREAYDDLIAEWFGREGDVSSYTITIDHLAVRYLAHCEAYYQKNGKPTGETANVRIALRHLVKIAGTMRGRDFGPKLLKAVRQSMIDDGYVRTSINTHVYRIRRMFKWAAAEEILPASVFQALTTVSGLQRGRTAAAEATPVKPVPEAFVEAVEPFVSRPVWGAIRLQLLTGMRSGEVLRMRGCDINMTAKVWEYTPSSHKTEHHDQGRVIFLGPQAQSVVREFLTTDLQAFLFSPRAGRAAFIQEAYREGAGVPAKGKWLPGERYSSSTYCDAIARACVKAGVPGWHPHQLRHNSGTRLRREFGIETARTVLGHTSAAMTELYAEADAAKAREAAAKLG